MSDLTDFTAALLNLRMLVQADDAPALTYGDGSAPDITRDLDAILENTKRAATFETSTFYFAGQVVMPTTRNGYRYRVVLPGTSGGTEPTWPTTEQGRVGSGANNLTFEEAGAEYSSIYDLRAAAYAALDLKCMKAANDNQYLSDSRGQASSFLFLNLMRQRDRYQPMGIA